MKVTVLYFITILFTYISLNSYAAMSDGYHALAQKDYHRAFQEFEQSAQLGNLESQNILALLYLKGLGTKADPIQAYAYYSLANKQLDNPDIQQAITQLFEQFNDADKQKANDAFEQIHHLYGQTTLSQKTSPLLLKKQLKYPQPKRISSSDGVSFPSFTRKLSPIASLVLEYDIGLDGKVRDIEVAHNYLMNGRLRNWIIEENSKLAFKTPPKKNPHKTMAAYNQQNII